MHQTIHQAMHQAHRLIAGTLFAVLFTAGAAPARAQAPEAARAMDGVELAYQLAEWGRTARSALALMAAADLVHTHAPRPLVDDGADTDSVPAVPAVPAVLAPLSEAELLDEAARFSVNDEMRALIRLLRRRADAGTRGSASGPRSATVRVAANAQQVLPVAFTEGEPAAVRVRAGAGRRITCEVRDARNRVLASDRGSSCFLNFTPSDPAPVQVIVRNAASEPVNAIIITN